MKTDAISVGSLLVSLGLLQVACAGARGSEPAPTAGFGNELPEAAGARGVTLQPRVAASEAFRKHWGDGKAEISGYDVTVMRYGQARRGRAALIYVTEDLSRRSWVKDDGGVTVKAQDKVPVLKLNHVLQFQTGIYPYSVMTSIFSPVNGIGRERFAPVKISFTAQEWCGHVFQVVKPTADRAYSQIRSYFSKEGDRNEVVRTRPFALYEDALLIQLRELDGPFAGGGDWRGEVVPTLWDTRKQHVALRPVAATITRSSATLDGTPVTRFVLRFGDYVRTYDVEKAAPRRVLGWRTNRGDSARLRKTERLAYWTLNREGHEQHLPRLGLPPPRR